MAEIMERSIDRIVDEAVRSLANAEHFRAGSIVSMPVTYPSGSTVVVEIIANAGRCFVSDRGGAFQEAEMFGSVRSFKKEAERVAESAGIRFDGRDMFVAEVSLDHLSGAMIVVANCSAEAAKAAALRAADRAENDDKEELFHRLSSLYRSRDVQKDAQLQASRREWKVSVAVFGGPKIAIFEPVSGAYISAVGTTAKFQDFAGIERPPARFGVIKSVRDLGDFYGLVAGASTNLITSTSPDSVFERMLEAA